MSRQSRDASETANDISRDPLSQPGVYSHSRRAAKRATWGHLDAEERRRTLVAGQQELSLGELLVVPSPAQAVKTAKAAARAQRAVGGGQALVVGVARPARHRQRWSDDEEAWLQRRLDEGAEYAAVAAELGRTRQACHQRAWLKTMVLGAPVCEQCGKAITQPQVGAKRMYCSRSCQHRAAHPPQEPLLRSCLHCSAAFVAADARQKHCTRSCSQAASYRRHVLSLQGMQAVRAQAISQTAGQVLGGEHAQRVWALARSGVSLRQICRSTGYGFRQVRSCVQAMATQPTQDEPSQDASSGDDAPAVVTVSA